MRSVNHKYLFAIILSLAPTLAVGQLLDRAQTETTYDGHTDVPAPTPSSTPVERDHSSVAALSLNDLENIALRHSPTLAGAAARVDAARGERLQVGLYPNPTIGYHATEVGNLGTAGQQGGFIAQRVVTGGKLRWNRAVAGMGVRESRFQYDVQQQRLLSDVRIRFYDALVTQQRVTLTSELARIGDDLVAASNKLLAGRQISENDLLLAEIEAEESHILNDNAHNETIEAWRRLSATVGLPSMEVTPLSGEYDADVPEYTWDDCYAMVLYQSPELEAARARIDRARFAFRRAEREPIPDIDLMVSVRHHNITKSDVANIQIGIPIPIFNANQGNISKAQAEWIAACQEVKRLELQLQDRLAVVYRRYPNARQQVNRYKQRILPRARRSLDLSTHGYNQGQVEYLTLNTSQRTFVRVNLSYLAAVRQLREKAILIEGKLLSGSLSSRP